MKEYATEYKKFKIIDLKGLDILTGSGVSEGVCNYIDSKNKYTYYYSLQTRIESV